MQFDEALKLGRLDAARGILDHLAQEPDTGGLWLPECYGDLAQALDRQGLHDEAIAAMELAIEHGWSGRPDPRSDIAEFHLRAGRAERAAEIWAELRDQDPDDVWLYNAAGLSYSEVGDHQLAITWLADGIDVAIRTDDPEGLVPQLSDVRRRSLGALGRTLDEVERRVDASIVEWRKRHEEKDVRYAALHAADDATPLELDAASEARGTPVAIAISWFPAGEYKKAIDRWESLAEEWAAVPHADYCRRLDGSIKWMHAHGVHVRAVTPIIVDEFVAWCDERDEDPEESRAAACPPASGDFEHAGRR